ncbi:radical SAM/SPASM domain-containing protein [Pseudomonas sp. EA_35y_Pfl2_R5]|uniref:radical SAM/SPASM domain-containing protein n=1 Tax=Pseudomonas sp. EA_35y_Pfl2_R5 TaxID=3088690 RepID=UPI0030D872F9
MSVILKLVGEVCNLDCSYCYEKRKPYEGARTLDPEDLRQLFINIPDTMFAIELHGGEPLLYSKRRFLELANLLKANQHRVARVTIQTNGTLLSEEWLAFLSEKFPTLQIGISCDGPEVHDEYRQDYQSRPSLDRVESAFRLCERERVNIGVICVVTRSSLGRSAAIAEYFSRWKCIKAVKLVPCFDYTGSQQPGTRRREELSHLIYSSASEMLPWAVTAEEYTNFLKEFSRAWQASYFGSYLLEPDISIIRKLHSAPVNHCHYTSKKCGHVLTLYPDGNVGACDELCKGDIGLAQATEFNLDIFTKNVMAFSMDETMSMLQNACNQCDYFSVCGGGCIATRRRLAEHGREWEYCQHRIATIANISKTTEVEPC